jgi:hypothetical protein
MSTPEPEKANPQPVGNSYADVMARERRNTPKAEEVPSTDITEIVNKKDTDISDLCLKLSIMTVSATDAKPKTSPSSIESIHSPKMADESVKPKVNIPKIDDQEVTIPKTGEKAVPAQKVEKMEEKPPALPSESVLFAPSEKKVNKSYGGWKGLKGDPAKLERLNQPRAKPLESRWAC